MVAKKKLPVLHEIVADVRDKYLPDRRLTDKEVERLILGSKQLCKQYGIPDGIRKTARAANRARLKQDIKK